MTPWHRNTVIYSLDVETFQDSDGDGVGDFQGLIRRLDYLADLGIQCLWLLPFHPTPNRDDGYDVADYYAVDPRLGTLGDFSELVREARRRGMRVLMDLVVNHTSVDHAWFQQARSDPASSYRDYYIWIDRPPERERRGGPVFPGEQAGNWAYDEQADAYYWHWFYDHQPDLNTGNPAVREEIRKIMGFWLDLGVSGFRIDAAPFLFKRKGLAGSHPEDPRAFLVELRETLQSQKPDAIFLAEADVSAEELVFFLGDGERMHLVLNFILNNHLFLALGREEAEPIHRALVSLPTCPSQSTWANFVRNHDELNLDRLAREEREELFERFAPDPTTRIYGRGIRRRVAPLLDGDRRHLEMVYSLVFSCPGVPVLRYGQEIGMGDDLALPGRLPVRTPMQWSDGPNGGFSTAPPGKLVRPVVDDDRYGFRVLNVDRQRRDPDSLLNFFVRLIRARNGCPEIGLGGFRMLATGDRRILAHRFDSNGEATIHIHNLSGTACEVSVDPGPGDPRRGIDLLSDRSYEPLALTGGRFRVGGYGYRWVRIPVDAATG